MRIGEALDVTVDEGIGGFDSSITVGADGNPIISYYDGVNGDLMVAACGDPACTSSTVTAVDDSAADSGITTSITLGTNGNPVISYFDDSAGDLKVAVCTTPTCTSASLRTIDSAGAVGLHTSIAIGASGFPVISYYDVTNADLKIAFCGNATCTSSSTVPLDQIGDVGLDTGLAIGADGLPYVSYYDNTNGNLKLIRCLTANCSSVQAPITIDSSGDVGRHTSITLGTNGFPVVTYQDATNGRLRYAVCTTANCLSLTGGTLDTGPGVGFDTSVVIGPTGNPVVSYRDDASSNLRIAACGTPTCGSVGITPVITPEFDGQDTSITLGADGNPIISHGSGDLEVHVCGNITCSPSIKVGL